MSRKCNNQGRAYEFAWINALADALAPERNVVVTKNSSYEANRRAWDSLAPDKQELYRISASAAIPTILELEPRMTENSGDTLTLTPQKDGSGITGDVRDMVIRRGAINWEIGLSIKHNHEAVKHCRLIHLLDFGKEWFDRPCSTQYWSDIKPGSNTAAEMYLNNGWQLNFRIHNAEDKIAPTLKFDIQFVGIPPEVLSIECRWDTKSS